MSMLAYNSSLLVFLREAFEVSKLVVDGNVVIVVIIIEWFCERYDPSDRWWWQQDTRACAGAGAARPFLYGYSADIYLNFLALLHGQIAQGPRDRQVALQYHKLGH